MADESPQSSDNSIIGPDVLEAFADSMSENIYRPALGFITLIGYLEEENSWKA